LESPSRVPYLGGIRELAGVVEEIYVTGRGSEPMKRVEEVRAAIGGLEGDRYREGTGYWTVYGDVCEVTLIEGEDHNETERVDGISVKKGEHRRNIITRGVSLRACAGRALGSERRFWSTIGPARPASTSRM